MSEGKGYDWEAGRSVNAIEAEERGLLPASRFAAWARKNGFPGCKTADVREVFSPAESHHTSKRFNLTDYFDTGEVTPGHGNFDEEVVENLKIAINKRQTAPRSLPVQYQCPICGRIWGSRAKNVFLAKQNCEWRAATHWLPPVNWQTHLSSSNGDYAA